MQLLSLSFILNNSLIIYSARQKSLALFCYYLQGRSLPVSQVPSKRFSGRATVFSEINILCALYLLMYIMCFMLYTLHYFFTYLKLILSFLRQKLLIKILNIILQYAAIIRHKSKIFYVVHVVKIRIYSTAEASMRDY